MTELPVSLVECRGVSFGYNTLVVDMTSLPQMRALGYPRLSPEQVFSMAIQNVSR